MLRLARKRSKTPPPRAPKGRKPPLIPPPTPPRKPSKARRSREPRSRKQTHCPSLLQRRRLLSVSLLRFWPRNQPNFHPARGCRLRYGSAARVLVTFICAVSQVILVPAR